MKVTRETILRVANRVRSFFEKRPAWSSFREGFAQRDYASYLDYVKHQRLKLDRIPTGSISNTGLVFRKALRARLRMLSIKRGVSVLCLGARLGDEVKAFIDVGCFAVGVDLNPGKENEYVVTGDFNRLQFADASVSVVYSNSLDHAFSLQGVAREVKRVLKQNGVVILELCDGVEEGFKPSGYESFVWKRSSDVVDWFCRHGFSVTSEDRFSVPWKGVMITMQKTR